MKKFAATAPAAQIEAQPETLVATEAKLEAAGAKEEEMAPGVTIPTLPHVRTIAWPNQTSTTNRISTAFAQLDKRHAMRKPWKRFLFDGAAILQDNWMHQNDQDSSWTTKDSFSFFATHQGSLKS